jgi:hypothetical protein
MDFHMCLKLLNLSVLSPSKISKHHSTSLWITFCALAKCHHFSRWGFMDGLHKYWPSRINIVEKKRILRVLIVINLTNQMNARNLQQIKSSGNLSKILSSLLPLSNSKNCMLYWNQIWTTIALKIINLWLFLSINWPC